MHARLARGPAPGQHDDNDDNDLQVLLATPETEHGEAADDSIRQLLENINRHLDCEFVALVVPERNLVTVLKG